MHCTSLRRLNLLDGISCSLFTSSPVNAQKFQRSVNVGQVGINIPLLGMPAFFLSKSILIALTPTAPSGPVLRTATKDSFHGGEPLCLSSALVQTLTA